MIAFPKIGYCFKLRSDHCFKLGSDVGTDTFVSHRMVVSRIIESGERLTKEQIGRFYNLYHDDVTEATFKRLAVFVRPRVLFWDFTNGLYRIYPWDEQTAKRIWERLVPIGVYDAANNTIEESHVRPILEKKLKALEKITTGTTELNDLFLNKVEPKSVPTVEVKPEDKPYYHKAYELYKIRKEQGNIEVGELKMWYGGSSTGKSLDPVLAVSWSEHAKVVTDLAALKATLKRHFPSLKFD